MSDKASATSAEIIRLRAEIKALKHDLFRAMDRLNTEAEEVDRLRATLNEAREYVARDLRGTLECVCTLDPVTLDPIESTMDPEEAEAVARIRATLARIDAALGDDNG